MEYWSIYSKISASSLCKIPAPWFASGNEHHPGDTPVPQPRRHWRRRTHAWTTTRAPESIAAGTRRRRHGDHTSAAWCLEWWAVSMGTPPQKNSYFRVMFWLRNVESHDWAISDKPGCCMVASWQMQWSREFGEITQGQRRAQTHKKTCGSSRDPIFVRWLPVI